jgi:hypothetical protein
VVCVSTLQSKSNKYSVLNVNWSPVCLECVAANMYNNKIILIYRIKYSSLQLALIHFSASLKQSYIHLLERHIFQTGKDYKSSPYDYIKPLPNILQILKK